MEYVMENDDSIHFYLLTITLKSLSQQIISFSGIKHSGTKIYLVHTFLTFCYQKKKSLKLLK